MDSFLCRYMLCEHGVFPLEVVKRSREEKQLMLALINRQNREVAKK